MLRKVKASAWLCIRPEGIRYNFHQCFDKNAVTLLFRAMLLR